MNRNFLEWSDQFRVGVDRLDHGHKELIDLYNRIVWVCENDLSAHNLSERIRSFLIYARYHFQDEETYMLSTHYKDYVLHKSEHDQLLQDTEDFIENVEGVLRLPDGQAIVKYFRYWLLRHTLTRDAELRRFASASLAGAAGD